MRLLSESGTDSEWGWEPAGCQCRPPLSLHKKGVVTPWLAGRRMPQAVSTPQSGVSLPTLCTGDLNLLQLVQRDFESQPKQRKIASLKQWDYYSRISLILIFHPTIHCLFIDSSYFSDTTSNILKPPIQFAFQLFQQLEISHIFHVFFFFCCGKSFNNQHSQLPCLVTTTWFPLTME